MPSLEDPELTLGNITAHTDVNEYNATKSSWATVMNNQGIEDWNDGACSKLEQMETPTVAE